MSYIRDFTVYGRQEAWTSGNAWKQFNILAKISYANYNYMKRCVIKLWQTTFAKYATKEIVPIDDYKEPRQCLRYVRVKVFGTTKTILEVKMEQTKT